ncbi:MAG: nucleotidyl transferase AbiEii/AbiGii toxin family protein, partial [Planctomycetota bacterium]
LGTHAEPIPHELYPIRPFAAEHFPKLFVAPTCQVTTMVARRTFWEKATILHAEYHRPLDRPLMPRYSRHYADVAMMAGAPVKDEAMADIDLLRRVVVHKDRFYHCGWARYAEAIPGSFRLLPRDERTADLHRDYQAMQVMFFGPVLAFDEILDRLASLAREINK